MTDPELHVNLRKLRERRKMLGLSQAEVARRLGVSSSVIGSIEKGESNLTIQNFRKICMEFNLDPLDIIELLRLKPISHRLIIRFRAACKREGTTPLQALIDFMEVFSND